MTINIPSKNNILLQINFYWIVHFLLWKNITSVYYHLGGRFQPRCGQYYESHNNCFFWNSLQYFLKSDEIFLKLPRDFVLRFWSIAVHFSAVWMMIKRWLFQIIEQKRSTKSRGSFKNISSDFKKYWREFQKKQLLWDS